MGNWTEKATGMVWGIREMKEHIDFLKDFDPRTDVDSVAKAYSHAKYRRLVGRAANVIYMTTLYGTKEEIERAVKFSMIAIDAEKHLLDVEQAKEKYGFNELEQKYVKGEKTSI